MARSPKSSPRSSRRRPRLSMRDFLASESGDASPGEGAPFVAFGYPNDYSVGMASLGYQVVLRRLCDGGARVERFFVPPVKGARAAGSVQTCESGASLSETDVVAFSVAYELDFLQIVQATDKTFE